MEDGARAGRGSREASPATATSTGRTAGYRVAPLDVSTWPAFARLVEKHNGIWGGCWCTWFHTMAAEKTRTYEGNRDLKERLVREGRAHAALVSQGEDAVGWCQYGSPRELPNIYHRKEYLAEMVHEPDYRITCFFVDRAHRRQGVAALALAGALDLIAIAGGGLVEAYPQEAPVKKVSGSLLYSCTRATFERAGFSYDRPKGLKHCVMHKVVSSPP
ncbi:MAG: GNAT family N-acetyltransferase [Candidatus Dormibacteria bacterium]